MWLHWVGAELSAWSNREVTSCLPQHTITALHPRTHSSESLIPGNHPIDRASEMTAGRDDIVNDAGCREDAAADDGGRGTAECINYAERS